MHRGLLFDLDGTLWDATGVIRPVWNRVLQAHGLAVLDKEAFDALMGLTKAAIAAKVLPTMPEAERMAIIDECFTEEQKKLRLCGGKLYPGLRETLTGLQKDFDLFIVSNCAPGYLEAFFAAHGLRDCFTDWETHGGTGLSKGENIRLVCRRNGLDAAYFIGDTVSDASAAAEAGLPFIHAAYGFGEVAGAPYRIQAVGELPALVRQDSLW